MNDREFIDHFRKSLGSIENEKDDNNEFQNALDEISDRIHAEYHTFDVPGELSYSAVENAIRNTRAKLEQMRGFLTLGLERRRARNKLLELESLIQYQQRVYPMMFTEVTDHQVISAKVISNFKMENSTKG